MATEQILNRNGIPAVKEEAGFIIKGGFLVILQTKRKSRNE